MKLVLYDDYKPGLLKGDHVIDISRVVQPAAGRNGQETMEGIIANFDSLRSDLTRQLSEGKEVPLASVRLRAPLPRPGKVIAMGVNYLEFTGSTPFPIWSFYKAPESVLDPGGTIVLPPDDFRICHHEAELVVVIGRQCRDVRQAQAMDCVFGYTCGIDVSARFAALANTLWGKSYDTFSPLGPCIVTRDEVPDPHKLQVRLWVDGQLRHDYNTDDMAHPIPECIEYLSSQRTLNPGDVIFTGTNHQGIGPIQDGENVVMEIESIGRMNLRVSDERKRSWPKAIDREMAERVRSAILSGRI